MLVSFLKPMNPIHPAIFRYNFELRKVATNFAEQVIDSPCGPNSTRDLESLLKLVLVSIYWYFQQFQRLACIAANNFKEKCRLKLMRDTDATVIARVYPSSLKDFLDNKLRVERLAASGFLALRFINFLIRQIHEHLSLFAEEDLTTARRMRAARGVSSACLLLSKVISEFLIDHFSVMERSAIGKTHLGGGRSGIFHSREFYEVAVQLLWDNHVSPTPATSVVLLRTAIELKLREAVGLNAFASPDGIRFRSVSVRDILDKDAELGIRSPVPMKQVSRFYTWCNLAIHGGVRVYIAELWFALSYLNPLLRLMPEGEKGFTSHTVQSSKSDAEIEQVFRNSLKIPEDWQSVKRPRQGRNPG
jgi:hypothetical protein